MFFKKKPHHTNYSERTQKTNAVKIKLHILCSCPGSNYHRPSINWYSSRPAITEQAYKLGLHKYAVGPPTYL